MNLNTTLTVASLAAVVVFAVIMYFRARGNTAKAVGGQYQFAHELVPNTLEKILEHIKLNLMLLDKGELSPTLTNEQFDRAYRRKAFATHIDN